MILKGAFLKISKQKILFPSFVDKHCTIVLELNMHSFLCSIEFVRRTRFWFFLSNLERIIQMLSGFVWGESFVYWD